jgi:hypothetical protein
MNDEHAIAYRNIRADLAKAEEKAKRSHELKDEAWTLREETRKAMNALLADLGVLGRVYLVPVESSRSGIWKRTQIRLAYVSGFNPFVQRVVLIFLVKGNFERRYRTGIETFTAETALDTRTVPVPFDPNAPGYLRGLPSGSILVGQNAVKDRSADGYPAMRFDVLSSG